MATKVFTLTKRVYYNRLHRNGAVKCCNCEQVIDIGEHVVSKRTSNGKKTVLYHHSCAEELYII